MRLKIMLIITDLLNSLTVIYILAGLNTYGASLIGYSAIIALQPFIYPFGQPLTYSQSSFSYFSYTNNYFSSSGIQTITILVCTLIYLFTSTLKPKPL